MRILPLFFARTNYGNNIALAQEHAIDEFCTTSGTIVLDAEQFDVPKEINLQRIAKEFIARCGLVRDVPTNGANTSTSNQVPGEQTPRYAIIRNCRTIEICRTSQTPDLKMDDH
jgi:hypothetical protein